MVLSASYAKSGGKRTEWYFLSTQATAILYRPYSPRFQIFARKELAFERMSERDRKQIVAEV